MDQKKKKMDMCFRWCWRSFCIVFFCKKNLLRDLLILAFLVAVLGIFLVNSHIIKEKNKLAAVSQVENNIQKEALTEEEVIAKETEEIAKIQKIIDTSSWTPYQNTFYGFSLKYPNDWLDPVARKPATGAAWEHLITFKMKETAESNPFEGFDVEVYSVKKVKEFSNTDEFPKLKNAELATNSECASIAGHLVETGDYPAEEVYVPVNDPCYDATLFFTNTREEYFYNIFPRLKEGASLAGDPAQEISNHMPEFFSVVSNWKLIDIQRPKPIPPKPVITAPKPVSYKEVGGRLVCAKKNDKPGKSTKNKNRHLDMECCLDPDEYPNPWCYYDPGKYGKYL